MNDLTGLAYGIRLRGRLPEDFAPYLHPMSEGGGPSQDHLELHYRQVESLPTLEPIWESDESGRRELPPNGDRMVLAAGRGGFDLAISGLGCGLFRCRPSKIEIEWKAGGTSAAHYLFSYALPLWLETRGAVVLHGTALSTDGRAIGFLGRSGVGKSTLAAELDRLGWSFLADDAVVVRRGPEGAWRTSPGPPLVRLWPSALSRLAIAADDLSPVHEALEKRHLPLQSEGGRERQSHLALDANVGLVALYLLDRVPTSLPQLQAMDGSSPLTPREGLTRLIEHSVAAAPAAALGLSGQRLDLLADVAQTLSIRVLRYTSGVDSATRVRDLVLSDLGRLNKKPVAP